MFRLLKLASYVLLGYAVYEFFQGLTSDGRPSGRIARLSAGTNPWRNDNDTEDQPGQRMTTGKAARNQTEETNGGSAMHAVGRGVVER